MALTLLLCDPCLQAPKAQASKEAKALAASNSSKGKKKVGYLLPLPQAEPDWHMLNAYGLVGQHLWSL